MYKIVFSIPVHEKPEVIVDTVINFLTLNDNCAVVLHLSKGFVGGKKEVDNLISLLSNVEHVYVNEKSVETGKSNIIQTHILNFRYISSICEFEYFVMSASNELFFKKGLYGYISKYDALCNAVLVKNDTNWHQGIEALKDENLRLLLSSFKSTKIYGSQIEGQCYKKIIYKKICDIIEKYYNYNKMNHAYAREEIYFSTVFMIFQDIDINIKHCKGIATYCPWDRQYTMNVRINEIEKQLNEESFYFSCKRVPREMNDCVRAYIRQKNNYFDIVKEIIPKVEYFDYTKLKLKCVIRDIYDKLYIIEKARKYFIRKYL